MRKLSTVFSLLIINLAGYCIAYAQVRARDVSFNVFVTDSEDGRIINGIVFGKKGVSWESESTDKGMTKIKIIILPARGKTHTFVELFLLPNVPANQDWEMLDNGRVLIGDYKDPEAYTPVFLRRRRNNQLSQIPQTEPGSERFSGSKEEMVRSSLTYGILMYVGGNYRKAIDTFRFVLKQDPDNHIILHQLGKALTQAGLYKEAEEIFGKCVTIREDSQRATPFELVETLEDFATLLRRMDEKVKADTMQERANVLLRKLELSSRRN
jgi:tetratricopeptide (TPR) repeat protein